MLQSKIRRGELDREVTFIEKDLDNTVEGEDYVESWSPVSTDPTVAAKKKELPGADLIVGDQVKLYQKTVFTVDFRSDLSISNRLVHNSKVYAILSVNENEYGRGTYVDVLCNLLDSVVYPLIGIRTTGFKELDNMFTMLPTQINHKVLQAAHSEAAKVLVNEEHLLSPVGKTGGLADSHGVVKKSFSNSSALGEILVGPRRGQYKGHHAHLLEFGTKARKNKSGANRGSIRATHYLERAYNAKAGLVISNIATYMGTKLYSFIKRSIRKG